MAVTVNQPGETNTYNPPEAIVALVQAVKLIDQYVISFTTPSAVGTATAYHFVAPVAGTIASVRTVLNGAIATANNTLVLATNFTGSFVNATNGTVTIAFTSSAAGDVDVATPTAGNVVAAGNVIRLTDTGEATGTSTAGVTITINIDTDAVILEN